MKKENHPTFYLLNDGIVAPDPRKEVKGLHYTFYKDEIHAIEFNSIRTAAKKAFLSVKNESETPLVPNMSTKDMRQGKVEPKNYTLTVKTKDSFKKFDEVMDINEQKEYRTKFKGFMTKEDKKYMSALNKFFSTPLTKGFELNNENEQIINLLIPLMGEFSDGKYSLYPFYDSEKRSGYDKKINPEQNFKKTINEALEHLGRGNASSTEVFWYSRMVTSVYFATLGIKLPDIQKSDKEKKDTSKKPPSRFLRVALAVDYLFSKLYKEPVTEEQYKKDVFFLTRWLSPKLFFEKDENNDKEMAVPFDNVKDDARIVKDALKEYN